MKKTVTILFFSSILFLSSSLFAQVLFSDDFESGSPSSEWGLYRVGEELITAAAMSVVPVALPSGGSYVGNVIDTDTSYTGAALALAGDVESSNYSVEADVYCYTNHPIGSAYTGVVVYADSSKGIYIKMVADFDANQRIRLYNNKLDFTTFQYSFSHDFVADDISGGIPTEDGWHKMKVEVQTIDDTTTAFNCYFDGELLAGCPIYDTGKHQMDAGRYGLFSFQQGSPLDGYFDNFVAEELSVSAGDFADDFESGAPSTEWGLYRAGEELITAVAMSEVPIALPEGGSYVGLVIDTDTSYTGAALALAGDEADANYSVEADVYCYTNHPIGSAYTGVVVYADSSKGIYIKMVADFDANQRIRLYNNKLDFTTFQYSFSHDFGAADIPGGIPTEDGWHKMKVEVQTVDDTTTAFNCYFDGELLAGCPIYDTGKHQMDSGRYGLFSFQQGSPLNGYFDNFVKKDVVTSVEREINSEVVPQEFTLKQNYPNPFNPTTNISYQTKSAGQVSLVIYDILGSKVKTLVSQNQAQGYYTVTWNGRNDFGVKVNSGVYLYTLKAGQLLESKKMILMK